MRKWVSIFCIVLIVMVSALPTVAQTPLASPAAKPASDLSVHTAPLPHDAIRVCSSCEITSPQQAVAKAQPGDTIVVESGTYGAELLIDKPLRIVGVDWPVIDAHDKGTAIRIRASDVTIEGFEMRNSGSLFDREDSGMHIEGERIRVLNNRVRNCLFGINAAKAHDSEIAGNDVEGMIDVPEGLRGDAIKVWYSHRAIIHHNHVRDSRDSLVWYSNDVDVYDNFIEHSRYGFHFMNSDDGVARHNRLENNSVGIYLMYGKRFRVADNLIQGSRGPSGHGLGLKEVDGMDVIGNVIFDNRLGIYIDNSPLSPGEYGEFHHNILAYNDAAVGILPSSRNNRFTENSFVENLDTVTVLGEGPLAAQNEWSRDGKGNFWSDYSGYDANNDGIGDVPFRSQHLSERIMLSYPNLQLFRFSLAETAVDFGAEAVPMFQKDPLLVDDAPLMKPVIPQNAPEISTPTNPTTVRLSSLALLGGAGLITWWGTRRARVAKSVLTLPEPTSTSNEAA